MLQDFKDFLKEYKIIGLATAFVMGAAINSMVSSLVNDLLMPIITPFIPGGAWKDAELILGPVVLKIGSFLGNLLNFFILAVVVFLIIKSLKKK